MKGASLKTPHAVRFQLKGILEKAELRRQPKDERVPGTQGREGGREAQVEHGRSPGRGPLRTPTVVDPRHHTPVHTHGTHRVEGEPGGTSGHGVRLCKCRVSHGGKCSVLAVCG